MSNHRTDNFCITCGAPLQEGKSCEKCNSQAEVQPYVKPNLFTKKNQKVMLILNIIALIISVPLSILILLGDSSNFEYSFIISILLDINPGFIISLIVIQILGFAFNVILYIMGPEKFLKKFSFLTENLLYALWIFSVGIGGLLFFIIGSLAVLLLIGLVICLIILR